MVSQKGVDGLSLHKLAKAVDYTPGALYRYFASKDALLAALVEVVIHDLAADLGALLRSLPDAGPLTRVLAISRAYRRYASAAAGRFGLLTRLASDPRFLIADHDEAMRVMTAMIAGLSPLADALGAAAAAGLIEPGDASERTLMWFAALQGTLQLRKQAARVPKIIHAERLEASLERTLLRGLGATPEAVLAASSQVASFDHLFALTSSLDRGTRS